MDERIVVAQMGKERSLLERLLTDRSNVCVLYCGVDDSLWFVEGGELIQTIVGYLGHTEVGFARVGVCLGFDLRPREDFEQRCLADLRQTDDSGFHEIRSSKYSVLRFPDAKDGR